MKIYNCFSSHLYCKVALLFTSFFFVEDGIVFANTVL